jgi:hypothetical protein
MVIAHARFAKIDQQFRDRVPSYPSHAGSRAKAISLDQCRYDPNALDLTKQIHTDNYA